MAPKHKPPERHPDDYDALLKVVVVGDSGVGKSNLLMRYTKGTFSSNSKATIGVEFAAKTMAIQGKVVKAQIWDTAGQERYRAISAAYYRGAAGALLVYDVTRPVTLDNAERWLQELRDHGARHMAVVLVGNKSDLREERALPTEAGEDFARRHGLMFLETSALENASVGAAFERLVHEVFNVMVEKRLIGDEGGSEGEEDRPLPSPGTPIVVTDAPPARPAVQQSRCCIG